MQQQQQHTSPRKPPAPRVMRTETLGHSVEGRPIVVHTFGTGSVGTLVMAGIHGDESSTLVLAERLIFMLSHGELSDVLQTSSVAIIPVANPDGVQRGTRTNARRVDVNRNFPASNWGTSRKGTYHGGPAALSEPETVAIQKAVQTLRPRRIISIHSITRGRHCNNYDGPAEQLAQRMAKHNGYPVTANIGYPTPGSFGSWAGIDLQIPVITLELPRDLPGELAWQSNRAALIEALRD
jgi:murein peptide amidase A